MTPTIDIHAVLVAHKLWLQGNPEGRRADLTGAYLTGANLAGANLAGAYLTRAYLTGANLAGAYLTRANLTGANLAGANLAGANLAGAYLTRANLTGADLTGANLTRTDLTGANLTRTDLAGTCVSLLLGDDGRCYRVVAHRGLLSDGEPVYLAGCRKLSIVGARAHWSNPDHPDRAAAARILAAIETHQAALNPRK